MFDPASQAQLKQAIADCLASDQGILQELRDEIRPLRQQTKRIQPRATTSISLVGTDGGNNQLQFDPFLVQLIRVVDSSNNEYCLEAISPTTPIDALARRHFDKQGAPISALGEMMMYLGRRNLAAPFAHDSPQGQGRSGVAELGSGVSGTLRMGHSVRHPEEGFWNRHAHHLRRAPSKQGVRGGQLCAAHCGYQGADRSAMGAPSPPDLYRRCCEAQQGSRALSPRHGA